MPCLLAVRPRDATANECSNGAAPSLEISWISQSSARLPSALAIAIATNACDGAAGVGEDSRWPSRRHMAPENPPQGLRHSPALRRPRRGARALLRGTQDQVLHHDGRHGRQGGRRRQRQAFANPPCRHELGRAWGSRQVPPSRTCVRVCGGGGASWLVIRFCGPGTRRPKPGAHSAPKCSLHT